MNAAEFSVRPMTEEDTGIIRLWQYEDVDERPGVGWPATMISQG